MISGKDERMALLSGSGGAQAATVVDVPAALAQYRAAHGGAVAAIEYLGKRGAQIVLTAPDGPQVTLTVDNVADARQACADAGITVDNGWERELTELARPSHDLWRAQSRRSLAR